MEFISIVTAVKKVADTIISIRQYVDGIENKRHYFFSTEIVERVHESMCMLHGFYMDTFLEAGRRYDEGDVSIQELLKFLSERDLETHVMRDDLHGLVLAASNLEGLPKSVHEYLIPSLDEDDSSRLGWRIARPRHRWREAKGFGETRPAIEGSVIGYDHRELVLRRVSPILVP